MRITKGSMIKDLYKVGIRKVEGVNLHHLKTPIITNLWLTHCK